MSARKAPLSLRRDYSSSFRPAPSATASVVSLVCLTALMPLEAQAQTSLGLTAPVTVDAPQQKKKKVVTQARGSAPAARKPKPVVTRAPKPQPVAPVQAAVEPGPTPARSANPFADARAPYKVNRSASGKITEPLLDTPRTIVAIPKEVLDDKGATSVRELVRSTPGLTLGSGEGGNAFGDRVFIRGFDARNDTYVDGVRDFGVNVRENFNIEQIEVLKGPSSTLSGRGTAGGAINIITKKPAGIDFYEFATTLGTDNTKRQTFDINKTIGTDWAIRANGMWQNADVAGRDYVFDNRWGGALAVQYKPNEQFKINLDYSHTDFDALSDWGVPYDRANLRPFTESGVRRNNYYGVPSRDFQKNKQDLVTLSAEWQPLTWLTLTNKLRYGKGLNDFIASAPEGVVLTNPNPALWQVRSSAKSRYEETEALVEQFSATAKFKTWGLDHTLVSGVEASRENDRREAYTGLATESFNVVNNAGVTLFNLWDPNAGSVLTTGTPTRNNNPTKIKVDSLSAYALDTVKFGNFIVNAGVRVDDYRIGTKSLNNTTGVVSNVLSNHSTMINWNGGIAYKLTPYGTVYAAYATSSNPVGAEVDGGANDYGGITATNATLGPEKNTGLELGTKWEVFDRRLLLTAALFETTKDRAREGFGTGPTATVLASGAYRIRGVELGAVGRITDKLSLFGGYVWMDSEVTKSNNAANVGLRLANIAHQSFNLLAKYQLTSELAVGAQATFGSKIWGGTFGANQNTLPSHWRFDAMAEYKFNQSISAKLNVQNLTNEVYYDAFYRSATPFVYMAPGRSASLTLNVKY